MTTYYVRVTGSNGNAGTSAGAAWATLTKALGSTGISSGDTVYVGPGLYREAVTVGMTSPTGTTSIIGDFDGSHTGDAAGGIYFTGNTTGDWPTTTTTTLALGTKNFLSFSNIVFEQAVSPAFTGTGHDITFTNCAFLGHGVNSLLWQINGLTVDIAANWLFDRCLFVHYGSGNNGAIQITAPTSATADYDLNFTVQNSIFYCFTSFPAVYCLTSGAQSFFPGGIRMRNCTTLGGGSIRTNSASYSTTIPCTVKDCLILSGGDTGINANTTGQITEDYNLIVGTTPRTNVTAGAHSNGSSTPRSIARISYGEEMIWGGQPRMIGTPLPDSIALGFGSSSSPLTVDFLNRPRPAGTGRILFSGTLTAGGTATASDTGTNFGSDGQLNGLTLKITGGTGSGQTMMIRSHTNTTLTGYSNWNTIPDNTSTYTVHSGNFSCYGLATGATSTTLTQSNANWLTNQWTGFTLETLTGTGSGQTNTVTSNTATALTLPAWSGATPDNTTTYKMYRQTNETGVGNTVGALERHNTAALEVALTDAGGRAAKVAAWGDQEVMVPVDAAQTTISVKCSFDTDHGNTNKPQIQMVANGEIGVAAQTVTASGTAGSGTFETISLTPFTPTAKGWVRIRMVARADKVTGRAIFDTASVS